MSALITDSITMELQAKQMNVLPFAQAVSGDAPDLGTIREQTEADFALSGAYDMAGPDIELSLRWIDLADLREAQRASRSGELNLSFDAVVASLVDELVSGQAKALAALPPEAHPVEPEPPAPAADAGPVAAAGPAAEPAAAAEPVPAAAPAVVEVRPPQAQPKVPLLAFSVGSAPFIATFTALNYFPLGLAVSINGRYQLRAPGGYLGFGIVTGVDGFRGRGAYEQVDFYVVPIGVDAMYGTLTGGAVDFFLHAGAGPAVLVAKPASGTLLAKVIPYVMGGVGVSWSPLEILAVSFDASYTSFFDSSAAIMGFTPSLSVVLKL